MMLKTDCFYIATKDLPEIGKIISEIGYDYKVESFSIVGRKKGTMQIILVDKETGEAKFVHFGNNNGLVFLDELDMSSESEKQETENQEIETPVEIIPPPAKNKKKKSKSKNK